jgi:hypothetical protein
VSTPSSIPSPGRPGWWLASDGQVYPQRWETTFIYYTNESLQAVIDEASRLTNAHGKQGWEIVNSSVQRTQVAHRFKGYDKNGCLYFEWSIVCTLKRPLPPE